MKQRWGVFLDRDGTLVPDRVHPVRPEQLAFYRRAPEALRRLAGLGAKLVVVSNQSAVARGLLTPAGLRKMDAHLRRMVRDTGARLHATYYCPHHPDFTRVCRCRKPAPGMIRDGLRDLRLDRRASYLVGDTASDLRAARAAGVAGILVLTGHGPGSRADVERAGLATAVVRDVAAAARWIERDRARAGSGRP